MILCYVDSMLKSQTYYVSFAFFFFFSSQNHSLFQQRYVPFLWTLSVLEQSGETLPVRIASLQWAAARYACKQAEIKN